MSIVNAADQRLINTPEDVIGIYCCTGEESLTGAEVELSFFDPKKPGLPIMTPSQNKIVMDKAVKQFGPGSFNNEPASDILEANSFPAKFRNLQTVFDDIQSKTEFLRLESEKLGLKRSWFQDLPHVLASGLLKSIVDVERYQAFFNPPREDMMDIAAYFTVMKSTQVSISYKNFEHMHKNVRRLYLLAPFLFMLTDNTSGFNEGQPFTGHSGMHHRASLKDRGGFPPYIFTAEQGEDYIRAHIDNVMTNPLYVYYDEDGKLQRLPSGTWWTFDKELRERGLNTAANYYLAQSILWPDVKLAGIRDLEGNVTHHRYEARMFGVGIHQVQTALLIVAGLAFDENFADKVDFLLRTQGLCIKDAPGCVNGLRNSYSYARNHNGKFFDIIYGNGFMADFARKFADAIEQSFECKTFAHALEPILRICRTGWTDGKVNRAMFPTLEAVNAHQQSYDPEIFKNPGLCAHMIFEKDLAKAA